MALSLPEAVYAAEAVLHSQARQFRTMKELATYANDLVESDWFIESFPWVTHALRVDARSSSARFSVCTDDGIVAIANNPDHRTVSIVLHELAHYVTGYEDGHGAKFRGTMLTLVRREMGFHAWVALTRAYEQKNLPAGVDIRLESV